MRRLSQISLPSLLAAASLATLTGCPDREVVAVDPNANKVEQKQIPIKLNREVDIIFMVDSSGSMREEQDSLRANFANFVNVLRAIDGGLPDVHIGVITTDVGTSGGGSSAGCSGFGKNGEFQTNGVTLNGGVNFISDVADPNNPATRIKNYSGDLTTVFQQMANVGVNGCGFEQPLHAAVRALTSPANQGFLRPDAFLAIVFITDEDDCSMKDGGGLLANDPNLGALESWRCAEYGIICDGADNMDAVGVKTNCRPRDNSPYLRVVSEMVAQVKAVKGSAADKRIIVAGINGPRDPFETGRDDKNQPALKPSCMSNNGVAAPGVRLSTFLNSFRNQTETTICNEDLSDALKQVALLLKSVIGTPCFDAKLAVPYDCNVEDVQNYGDANQTSLGLLSQCDASESNKPCWKIEMDAVKCPAPATGQIIRFVRNGQPASDVVTTVACKTE